MAVELDGLPEDGGDVLRVIPTVPARGVEQGEEEEGQPGPAHPPPHYSLRPARHGVGVAGGGAGMPRPATPPGLPPALW